MPEAAGAASAESYIELVAERIGHGVHRFARSFVMTNVPEGAPGSLPPMVTWRDIMIAARDRRAAFTERMERMRSVMQGLDAAEDGTGRAYSAAVSAAEGDEQARTPDAESRVQQIRARLGDGSPLPPDVRSRMEEAFGEDVAHVRVHTNDEAAHLAAEEDARAFAVGSDVVFGAGAYRPGTIAGDGLIAHELAHAIQQRGSETEEPGGSTASLEYDAERSTRGALARLMSRGMRGARSMAESIRENARPALRSGLGLMRCAKEGPEAVSEAAENRWLIESNQIWIDVVNTKTGEHLLPNPWATGQPDGGMVTSPDPARFPGIVDLHALQQVRILDDSNLQFNLMQGTRKMFGGDQAMVEWLVQWHSKSKYSPESDVIQNGDKYLFTEANSYAVNATISLNGRKLTISQIIDVAGKAELDPVDKQTADAAMRSKGATSYSSLLESIALEYLRRAKEAGRFDREYAEAVGWDAPKSESRDKMSSVRVEKDNVRVNTESPLQVGMKENKQWQKYGENRHSLNEWAEYRKNVSAAVSDVDIHQLIPLRASYVPRTTGKAVDLMMFVGRSVSNPKKVYFLDLSPGAPTTKYSGTDINADTWEFDPKDSGLSAAIDDFRTNNSYPNGIIQFEVPNQGWHKSVRVEVVESNGASFWKKVAEGSGIISLFAAFVGIALSASGLGAPAAPYFFYIAMATGAVSAGTDLYAELRKANPAASAIAMDIIGLAASALGAGSFLKGVAQPVARGLRFAATAGDAAGFVIFSADAYDQARAILNNRRLTDDERQSQMVALFANLLVNGGMLIQGMRSGEKPPPEERPLQSGGTEESATGNGGQATSEIDNSQSKQRTPEAGQEPGTQHGKETADGTDIESAGNTDIESSGNKEVNTPEERATSTMEAGAEGAQKTAKKKIRNGHLAGKQHPKTGVPFNANGYPIFESKFDVHLPPELIGPTVRDGAQFEFATRALRDELERQPGLRKLFTEEQLRAIQAGEERIPDYTWHHHEDGVRLQLVDRNLHGKTGHSGGREATGGRPRTQRKGKKK
ncbi:MAG TPA: DUF4157 domain-containing protein [Candidatus Kapabacteria bacterium]|nr:DUF4157 domain-containing protein [Candidatus Kapabacteria bacterium]